MLRLATNVFPPLTRKPIWKLTNVIPGQSQIIYSVSLNLHHSLRISECDLPFFKKKTRFRKGTHVVSAPVLGSPGLTVMDSLAGVAKAFSPNSPWQVLRAGEVDRRK